MSARKLPPPIGEGGTIGIYCPSSAITLENARLEIMSTRLRERGFDVLIHPASFEKNCLGNAGSPAQRAQAFNELVASPQVNAILSFWGGQDTIEILPHIDFERFAAQPRWVCGYSDAGVLLQALSERTNIPTLYGIAGVTLSKRNFHDVSWDSFHHLASGVAPYTPKITAGSQRSKGVPSQELEFVAAPPIFRHGRCRGVSLVSSIAALCALLGTPWAPAFDGRVLFLELSEDYDAQQFCRFIAQLSLSGAMHRIAGLVFSKFMEQSGINAEVLRHVISSHVKPDIPVILEMDFGHTDPIIALPNYCEVVLDTTVASPLIFP